MKLLTVAEACPLIDQFKMELDVEGWNSDHSLFAELIDQVKPQTIVEVGTWKGASALHMAGLTRDLGTKIFCVDTFLGDPNPALPEPVRYNVGDVFRQFCFNVAKSGFADRVYPVPQTSSGAAKILWAEGITCGLCYLDGDHSYEGTFADLESYAPLVLDGGYLFGDDWHDYAGIRMAVTRYAFENNLRIRLSGPAWVLEARQ